MASIGLSSSWLAQVGDEFERDYMVNLKQFLLAERSAGREIFPKGSEYFAALNAVAYEDVKVVILGQDPYHGPGQAHGLSFSVPKGVRIPPSLKNIYQELMQDLGLQALDFSHGYLERWASQGVLLLNSVLTVRAGAAASHRGKGWEQFPSSMPASVAAGDAEKRKRLRAPLWCTNRVARMGRRLKRSSGPMGNGGCRDWRRGLPI